MKQSNIVAAQTMTRYQMSKDEYTLYCFECECNGEIPMKLEFINGSV